MKDISKERVRDEIRAEIAKRNPVESARTPLELIAETSIRFVEGRYEVVDSEGQPRTKVEGGEEVGLTIQDLADEIRSAHPTLFRSAEDSAKPAAPENAAERPAAAGERSSPLAQKDRDWLFLGSGEPPPTPAAPQPKRRSRFGALRRRGGLVLKGAAARLRLASGAFAAKLSGLREARLEQPTSAPVAFGAPPSRMRTVYGALAAALALLGVGYLMLGSAARAPSGSPAARRETATASRPPSGPAVTSRAPPSEPAGAGVTSPSPQAIPAGVASPVSGVPEVIDTSTLRIDGKVVRLFGVEWARGGQAEDLTRYLRNREVACRPAPAADAYRCQVDGRDLSEVVLFNGGGRATPGASPDLVAAEQHARAERVGIWRK